MSAPAKPTPPAPNVPEQAATPLSPPAAATGAVPCASILTEAARQPGIVNVDLDPRREVVSFTYDPEVIDEPHVQTIAGKVLPAMQERVEMCQMLLGRKGGRACENCATMLEHSLLKVPGVEQAHASYMGGVLSVAYDSAVLTPDSLAQRVRRLGVPLTPPTVFDGEEDERAKANLHGLARLRAWLTLDRVEMVLTVVTLVAMLVALAIENWGGGASTLTAVLFTVAYAAGGAFGLKGGIESLMQRTLDIDLLMVLAAIGAAIVGAPFEGAMLLFLFSLSNVLQAYAMDRTRNAIKALMKLRPKSALVKRGSETVMLPIERIVLDDIIVVRPGERIAMDGIVAEGESAVDQSSITGESIPVAKAEGDTVFAGTINKNGSLQVRVSRLAKDSTIARLIMLVEEAHSEKAKTQRFIDKMEQYYAAVVIGFTALAIVLPLFWGEAFETALYRAMTIMVAASPCALVISTPASILSAIGNGARRGVLFKGGVHLEKAMTVKAVAFDKTGTLTQGHPQVTDVRLLQSGRDSWSGAEDDLIGLAAAVQTKSEHALARATVEAAKARALELSEAFAFQATTGKGVRGTVDGKEVRIGNLRYFEELDCAGFEEAAPEVYRLESEGKTCVAVGLMSGEVGEGGKPSAHLLGLIAFADVLRPGVKAIIRDLKAAGVEHVVMLTGDNKHVAGVIAEQAGVDEVYSELLPEDKVKAIKEIMQKYGSVAMVGDGVNDAPALATATLGIAMGAAGTDVALETADVVLMGDDLSNIPYLIRLSHATRRTLITNLGFAGIMIAIMLLGIFSIQLPLPLAVVGHEGGTVLVSLNGLRLLAFRKA